VKFIEQLQRLERLDQLIRLKMTGTPSQLASRLNMSERNVYNLIEVVRALGIEVYYCEQRNSYCYAGNFHIRFLIHAIDNSDEIIGGEKKLNIFSLLQNFCSDPPYLCNETFQNSGYLHE
jgi:hypothetical protein